MKKTIKACKQCGTVPDDGHLSRRGLCFDCGYHNMCENITQLRLKTGNYYYRWLTGYNLAVIRINKETHDAKTKTVGT